MGRFDLRTRSGLIYPIIQGQRAISNLLDLYPNSAASYSLRLLKSDYLGNAIRVRRSNDNTETNIGFDIGGNLDTLALTTFCGSNNGFITEWYDQSGNANNLIQTSASSQPRIVNAGTIITDSGKPTIEFLGNGFSLLSTNQIDFLYASVVNKPNVTSVYQTILGAETSDSVQVGAIYFQYSTPQRTPSFTRTTTNDSSGGSDFSAIGSSTVANNVTNLITGTRTSTSISIFANGINLGNDTTSNPLRPLGGTDGGKLRLMAGYYSGTVTDYLAGNIQEVILYTTDQSTNRLGIETNINNFYSIY